jgi:tetratricopeptide (TPR) repeat protein/tRNA A-37 threonylcarbamoyl transferase component Bud32
MEPERWQKVEGLLSRALKLDESRRAAFLMEACAGDAALKQEVESLLSGPASSDSFLEAPARNVAAESLVHTTPIPAAIGRYRVIRLLGEGGMGAVYEAEQDHPRRVVALKVVKPGLATAETLRRFQYESEALGRLQHPGIAQIYEASTADSGFGPQPYFAMELIRGRPLLECAKAQHLSARERLALLAKVCDAVEHAHQRGVIHRDLKPGNILVDETGQPKILDFGVARVTESDAQHTRQTDLGQLVGTLAYMSPEQASGDPSALDPRSDVYAMGVILYELLAGRLPYDINRKPLREAVDMIQEAEPAALSSIDRRYRGDIDTIVARALEKDKARRYGSAADLAADIRRHLADEPIAARPASASYQLQKFARRHKALVSGAVAVLTVLAVGVVVSTLEAVWARTAEATAEAVNNFLQNDLLAQASANKQAGSGTKPDPHLEVRTVLDRAAGRIAGKFDKQPEAEAAIRDTIGQTYMDLGLYPDARKQFERALELHRRELGVPNPKTLKTMSRLGRIALLTGRYQTAEALLGQCVETQRRRLGPQHPDTLYSISNLAGAYLSEGKYSLGEPLLRQVLEIRRLVLGPEHPDTLSAMNNLASAYEYNGKLSQAEILSRQAFEMRRRVLGPDHPNAISSMNNLATIYTAEGKYAQAESLLGQVLEIERRVLGPEHVLTIYSTHNLAAVYNSLGKFAQAEAFYSEALDVQRRVFGADHSDTLMLAADLASVYVARRKYAPAEALYERTLGAQRRTLGPDNTFTLDTTAGAAYMYQREGKFALAETYASAALAGRRRALGPEHPLTVASVADVAMADISQRKFAEAEKFSRQAVDFYRKAQPDGWRRFCAEGLLGASLAGQKKYAEAEPLLLEGYQGMLVRKERIAVPDQYYLDRAHAWLVQLYQAWGKPEKAAEWRLK